MNWFIIYLRLCTPRVTSDSHHHILTRDTLISYITWLSLECVRSQQEADCMWTLSSKPEMSDSDFLSAGNGPLFIAVNISMYGMQQHNYSLLYYTHLNRPDSINTRWPDLLPTHSRAQIKALCRFSSEFRRDAEAVAYIASVALLPITVALTTFIVSELKITCKIRHFCTVSGQWFVLILSPNSSLKYVTNSHPSWFFFSFSSVSLCSRNQ